MTKQQMIELLNGDIRNEYKHMNFYLHSACIIQGLHREELREYLLEEASREMKHVKEFADLIVGLGGQPQCLPNEFPTNITDPLNILRYAFDMETEVVANYVERINQATELGGVDGKWIEIFLKSQIQDSREDVDNLSQMILGV